MKLKDCQTQQEIKELLDLACSAAGADILANVEEALQRAAELGAAAMQEASKTCRIPRVYGRDAGINDLRQAISQLSPSEVIKGGVMTVWEFFKDEEYYGLWCVRPKGCTDFGAGFHVNNANEAETLKRLLNRYKVFYDFKREQEE